MRIFGRRASIYPRISGLALVVMILLATLFGGCGSGGGGNNGEFANADEPILVDVNNPVNVGIAPE